MDKATDKPPIQKKHNSLEVKKLNDSARLLLSQLPDHVGELVENLSSQYQIPIWQYTTGILLAVHLEGRLSEFRLDPAWKDGLKTKELVCKHCNKSFKPLHIGQPYCSNTCGLEATAPKELRDDPIPIRPSESIKPSEPGNWNSVDTTMEAA